MEMLGGRECGALRLGVEVLKGGGINSGKSSKSASGGVTAFKSSADLYNRV